ncbi:MAG: hypothetical protein HZA59_08840 [Hydrogenophilales bacterium]|nr:hypothetical protein [Hydrogenophilales bacterium]
MNRYNFGLALSGLGTLILASGLLHWRLWIFTRQESRFRREEGEDAVFMRRKVAGVTGIVLGVVVMLFGNF